VEPERRHWRAWRDPDPRRRRVRDRVLLHALPGHPHHRTASDDDRAWGFEAFYEAALTPAAHVAFDVQVLRSLPDAIDTAVVLGARLNLAF